MQVWLTSGKSSDDVFTLLKLDKAEKNFFDNPLYKTWSSYMNGYNNKHPGKETNLFKTLTTHYNDKRLIKILEEAKKYPHLESTASKLQTEKIQSHLASKESPDEIFNLLGLGDAWDNVLGNPLFKIWLDYVKKFDRESPGKKTDWYFTLHGAYGDGRVESMVYIGLQNPSTLKIAEMVQAELLKSWLASKDSPDLTFKWILRRPKADAKVFTDPRFETWAKYLSDFNQRYPDKKTTMIDGLLASYAERDLLGMFDAARKVPSTEKLATTLEDALLNKWVRDKESPASISTLLTSTDINTADEMIQRYIEKFNAVSENIA
uniref:RxLR effector PexRD54 WY domain-containing protein n=1 Tax=Phytophthora ramorum TaxID=164328 RepID=H3H3G1_PHYRM